MGYYFEGSSRFGKGEELVAKGARKVTQEEARELVDVNNEAVICVVDSGSYEAAGLIYDLREFRHFAQSSDRRPKTWYALDKVTAFKLTNYPSGTPRSTKGKELEKRE